MPSYLQYTNPAQPEKPTFAGVIFPNRSEIIGTDGDDDWLVATCHWHDICTHIFKVAGEENISLVDGQPVTENGDAIELTPRQAVYKIEDGDKYLVQSAEETDSGLLIPVAELAVVHTTYLLADYGGREFYK